MCNFFEESLLKYNGTDKQLAIIQGELGELITAISNYFYRNQKGTIIDLIDEIVDNYLMMAQLKLLISKKVHLPFATIESIVDNSLLCKKNKISERFKKGTLK